MTKKSIIFIFVSNVLLFTILFAMLNYEGQSILNSLKMSGSVSLENEGVFYTDEEQFQADIQYLNDHDYNYIVYKDINEEGVVEMTCRNYELVIDYDCSSKTTKTIDGITYAPLETALNETFIKVEGVSYIELSKNLKWQMSIASSAYGQEFTKQMKVSFVSLMLLLCFVYAYLIFQLTLKHLSVLILIGFSSIKVLSYFMLRFTMIQIVASIIVYLINYKYFTNFTVYHQFIDVSSPTIMLLLCNGVMLIFNVILLSIVISGQLKEFKTLEEIEL